MAQRWHLSTTSHFSLKIDCPFTKNCCEVLPDSYSCLKLLPDSYNYPELLPDSYNCCKLLCDSYNCRELFWELFSSSWNLSQKSNNLYACMLVKCFHSGRIIYSTYWLVVLAYITYICNIISFSNVKSSWAESSEQVRTSTVVLLKRIFLQRDNNIPSIDISLRQLHRLLHQQNLYKRYHKGTVNVALETTKADIDGPSSHIGNRSINQKLIYNGIKTDRETVRLCLKTVDPEGVKRREAHKGNLAAA